MIAFCSLVLLCLGGTAQCQRDASQFYTFSDATASSTYNPTGAKPSPFSALAAIQPGNSYWCSAGLHTKDDLVTWTGIMPSKGQIQGIRVKWAYAPQEVQVSASQDRINFHVVIPNRRTPSDDVAFDEDLYFKTPEECAAIRLEMKGARFQYFGMNQVELLGTGNPLMMIISGITSPGGDQCLQVEGGQFNLEGAEVVLQPCIDGLAAGDGRELWRSNANNQLVSARSSPPMCMTLENGKKKGRILLQDCTKALENADGRSNWSFENNSQLRLQKAGSFCLSQKDVNGSTAGMGNVLEKVSANIKASSNSDETHDASKAIDRKLKTYWASGAFPDVSDHVVNVDLDLGKSVKLSKLRIDWEYPALTYEVLLSTDDKTYTSARRNLANPSTVTQDSLGGNHARYIRLQLERPHPVHGKLQNDAKWVYGIRNIEVLANNLESSMQDCKEAANTNDARDKYFVEYTGEFDAELSKQLEHIDHGVTKIVKEIAEAAEKLTSTIPQVDACHAEKVDREENLTKMDKVYRDLKRKYQETSSAASLTTNLSALIKGESSHLPADDCHAIKAIDPDAPSGYYWLLPRCSPAAIRVYCDMHSKTSILIVDRRFTQNKLTEDIKTVDDIRAKCSQYGLEPMVIKLGSQLDAIKNALKTYKLDKKELNIPLAYDYHCNADKCKGQFGDLLDGTTDLTGILMSNGLSATGYASQANTAGIGSNLSIIPFDILGIKVTSLVCSTNTSDADTALNHVDIECDTTAATSDLFSSATNTNFLLSCPPGCNSMDELAVYGSKGIYTDSSSICRAALHNGAITNQGGVFTMAVESPRAVYEGMMSNGILSKSYNTPIEVDVNDSIAGDASGSQIGGAPGGKSARSIRVGPFVKECPVDEVFERLTSFMEVGQVALGAKGLTSFMEASANEPSKDSTAGAQAPGANLVPAELAQLIEKTIAKIDELHGLDPFFVHATEREAAMSVLQARKKLKPSEKLQEKQESKALDILHDVMTLASTIYDSSGVLYNRLNKLSTRLDQVVALENAAASFGSFSVLPLKDKFSAIFEPVDSPAAKGGPGHWGFSNQTLLGKNELITHRSNVAGNDSGRGSWALIKGKHLYDFKLKINALAWRENILGIGYRLKDINNTYLLTADAATGKLKLIRLENAEPIVIAQVPNIFKSKAWKHMQIEVVQGRHTISIGEDESKVAPIIEILDEKYMWGTIGLFAASGREANMGDSNSASLYSLEIMYQGLTVEALPCQVPKSPTPPKPTMCSQYLETYFGTVHMAYEYPSDTSPTTRGIWGFRKNIAGRPRVVAQLQAVDDGTPRGSILLIKKKYTCRHGTFQADIYQQCSGGKSGLVFKYESPLSYLATDVGPKELRLIWFKNSEAIPLARVPINNTQWLNLSVHFEGSTIAIRASAKLVQQTLRYVDTQGSLPSQGQVGLFTWNCGGSAFDNIMLSPGPPPTSGVNLMQQVPTESWNTCSNAIHILQRRAECSEMVPRTGEYQQIACARHFCQHCCKYRTSMLGPRNTSLCIETCDAQEPMAQMLQTLFLDKINECMSDQSPSSQHCRAGDVQCHRDACKACCHTYEGPSHPVLLNVKGVDDMERAECAYQCHRRYSRPLRV